MAYYWSIGVISDISIALYLLYTKIGGLIYITIIGIIVIGNINMIATFYSMKYFRGIVSVKDKRI